MSPPQALEIHGKKVAITDAATLYFGGERELVRGRYGPHDLATNTVALDAQGRLVPYATFAFTDGSVALDAESLAACTPDDAFAEQRLLLLLSDAWGCNFSHFVNQSLPKLLVLQTLAARHPGLRLAVHEWYHEAFLSSVLALLDIPASDVVTIRRGRAYSIGQLFTVEPCREMADDDPLKVDLFRHLRAGLEATAHEAPPASPPRVTYLLRNDRTMFGARRNLINEPELLDTLGQCGDFQLELVGQLAELDLPGKHRALRDVDVLVTQLGANLMNVVLTCHPRVVIVLYGAFFSRYHEAMLRRIDPARRTRFVYLRGRLVGPRAEDGNQPFSIDPRKVLRHARRAHRRGWLGWRLGAG